MRKREALPENGLELTELKPLKCCDEADLEVDRKADVAYLHCLKCGKRVETGMVQPSQLRGRNVLKRKERIQKAMTATLENLITLWNRKILGGG